MTTVERAWCSAGTCPANGKLKAVTTTTGAPASAVISDTLGREIKTATVGFLTGP